MVLSAQTAYSILSLIASAGTIYDEIINTVIQPNFHQKPELVSEIAISFLNNQDSVNKAIDGGYFNYYFINVVKNQVHSKTSTFHKNVRKTSTCSIPVDEIDIVDEQDDLEYKILNEKQNDILVEVLDDIKVSWFEKEIFQMYFEQGMTYRAIESKTGIDHCLCFTVIKKLKSKINKQIKEKDIY
jgi:RNA polymerase sigma factor (sigma-70 family)